MLSSFFQNKITIFWCIFIVYILVKGLIEGIASIMEQSFFTVNLTSFTEVFTSINDHFEVA